MVVPPRAIHTFKNPSETEDAEFFMTATPGKSSFPPIGSRLSLATLLPANSLEVVDYHANSVRFRLLC